MKYLFTNQNFHFPWVQFLKKDIYVNNGTLWIFDIFIKFNYVIEPNIFQLVSDFFTNSAFDFFTYSIVA